jgi:uncharacterized protein (DUF305 family)
MNQYNRVLENIQQALDIYRDLGDRESELKLQELINKFSQAQKHQHLKSKQWWQFWR